ncbi:MAG: glycoside hydrolase family 2 [Spirochaetales bacterium]|nr:glycoside hydrolase family 2 [Spirochaetales bacterium]
MNDKKGMLTAYPRPDFARKEWISLNGQWDFAFDDEDKGLGEGWSGGTPLDRKIQVPYAYQSALSGIGLDEDHPVVWYERKEDLSADFLEGKVLLHFGAVDFETRLWINGIYVGIHEGGNTAFRFEVSSYLRAGENRITLRVEDRNDASQPRGKQSWRNEPFGCWYTAVTGIWQSVWMEKTGSTWLDRVYITPDIDRKCARMELEFGSFEEGLSLDVDLSFAGEAYKSLRFAPLARHAALTVDMDTQDELDSRYLWHPEQPGLFDAVLTLKRGDEVIDRVETYFGMRKISCREGMVLINNVPCFQKLILDQGYWEESLLTPPDDEALKRDIEQAMAMGFNGARKHQKMEDPRFYYWADKLGFLVWGEMPSNYTFNRRGTEITMKEWGDFVRSRYNHPSIVTWVPVNESWGVWNVAADRRKQDFCNALYSQTKSIDSTRLVSGNDGWEQAQTDICAIHDYVARGEEFQRKIKDRDKYLRTLSDWRFLFAEGYEYKGQPVMLTEYGGIAFDDGQEGWGYQDKVKDEEGFLERFRSMAEAIAGAGWFSGFCYTQLTDVFQEVNGLLHMDRSYKIAPEKIRDILAPLRGW